MGGGGRGQRAGGRGGVAAAPFAPLLHSLSLSLSLSRSRRADSLLSHHPPRLNRVKDYLLLEQEFIKNQEALKPKHEKDAKELEKVEEIRGSPLSVGTLEEIIDDEHAIVSTTHGPEYYVAMMSFVDKDQLEPNATVLLHNKHMA